MEKTGKAKIDKNSGESSPDMLTAMREQDAILQQLGALQSQTQEMLRKEREANGLPAQGPSPSMSASQNYSPSLDQTPMPTQQQPIPWDIKSVVRDAIREEMHYRDTVESAAILKFGGRGAGGVGGQGEALAAGGASMSQPQGAGAERAMPQAGMNPALEEANNRIAALEAELAQKKAAGEQSQESQAQGESKTLEEKFAAHVDSLQAMRDANVDEVLKGIPDGLLTVDEAKKRGEGYARFGKWFVSTFNWASTWAASSLGSAGALALAGGAALTFPASLAVGLAGAMAAGIPAGMFLSKIHGKFLQRQQAVLDIRNLDRKLGRRLDRWATQGKKDRPFDWNVADELGKIKRWRKIRSRLGWPIKWAGSIALGTGVGLAAHGLVGDTSLGIERHAHDAKEAVRHLWENLTNSSAHIDVAHEALKNDLITQAQRELVSIDSLKPDGAPPEALQYWRDAHNEIVQAQHELQALSPNDPQFGFKVDQIKDLIAEANDSMYGSNMVLDAATDDTLYGVCKEGESLRHLLQNHQIDQNTYDYLSNQLHQADAFARQGDITGADSLIGSVHDGAINAVNVGDAHALEIDINRKLIETNTQGYLAQLAQSPQEALVHTDHAKELLVKANDLYSSIDSAHPDPAQLDQLHSIMNDRAGEIALAHDAFAHAKSELGGAINNLHRIAFDASQSGGLDDADFRGFDVQLRHAADLLTQNNFTDAQDVFNQARGNFDSMIQPHEAVPVQIEAPIAPPVATELHGIALPGAFNPADSVLDLSDGPASALEDVFSPAGEASNPLFRLFGDVQDPQAIEGLKGAFSDALDEQLKEQLGIQDLRHIPDGTTVNLLTLGDDFYDRVGEILADKYPTAAGKLEQATGHSIEDMMDWLGVVSEKYLSNP